MESEILYYTESKPFNHDKLRGKWVSSKDFLFACIGHSIRLDIFTLLPVVIIEKLGIFTLIPYFIILAVCVFPIVFIQTFLGQFSSTGYISVFRIAPLFKGIGYVSLVLNFVTLTYYSAFSALPLLYFVHSMRPTIPWSCEGAKQWMNINQTICNKEHPTFHKIPSFEFLRQHLNISNTNSDIVFSFQLMIYTAIILVIATVILLKSTEFIGRFMRYSFLVIIAVMGLCFLRFLFLPGALDKYILLNLFEPVAFRRGIEISISDLTILVFSTLGPGWGSILTMASFNDFKTNIYRFSWLVCLGQFGVFIGMGFIWRILTQVIRSYGISTYISPLEKWSKIFTIPTILSFMELPNFWSLLFFGMFVLGILNLLVIQLHSLFTSIFDEYENLREMKKYFILGAVIVLGFISMFFCTNNGLYLIEILSKFSILIQAILNMFLLLVVLWIYGRGRFQRDLNFMTSQVYSTWIVYVVRFVAPIVLGLLFCTTFRWIMERLLYFDYSLVWLPFLITCCIFYLKLCCLIPCYCIFKIRQLPGSIWVRLLRCVRPIDWYPADPIHKQNYEEGFSRTDSLRIFPMLVFVGAQIVLTYLIFNYFS